MATLGGREGGQHLQLWVDRSLGPLWGGCRLWLTVAGAFLQKALHPCTCLLACNHAMAQPRRPLAHAECRKGLLILGGRQGVWDPGQLPAQSSTSR